MSVAALGNPSTTKSVGLQAFHNMKRSQPLTSSADAGAARNRAAAARGTILRVIGGRIPQAFPSFHHRRRGA